MDKFCKLRDYRRSTVKMKSLSRGTSGLFVGASSRAASKRSASSVAAPSSAKLGLVDTISGDQLTVRNLDGAASTNSLLLFQSGGVGVVTDVRRDSSHVALVAGSPSANETAVVEARRASFRASIHLCGRVVDALGQPIDGLGLIGPSGRSVDVPITSSEVPAITERVPLHQCLSTGFKVIDSFYPVLRGSSVVLAGERGGDKGRLALEFLQSMAAADLAASCAGGQASSSSHFVYCSVGQSVAAVNDALIALRLSGAMARTTVIAAPANSHVAMLHLAPQAASAFAEYLARVHGKHVVLLIDNLSAQMMASWRAGGTLLGGGAWAQASATASFSLVPAIFDRSCHLTDECGGGSVTTIATIDSSSAAAAAAATSLTADLKSAAGASGASSSKSGDKATTAAASLQSPRSSTGPSVASVAAGLTREAIKAQEYTHHVCSLADTVIELEPGSHATTAAASSSMSSSGNAVGSSAAAGAANGFPLPLGFESFSLRHSGHAAQGEGLRHYAHLGGIVLRQLREAALIARAARELGLEHETDVDALLDLHQKAKTLLMGGGGSGGGMAAPSLTFAAVKAKAVPTPAKEEKEVTAAAAVASTTSASNDKEKDKEQEKDSLIPDDQRKAMEALIAKRAKDRATKSAASMAAAAGFAIRTANNTSSGAPQAGTPSAYIAAKAAAAAAAEKKAAVAVPVAAAAAAVSSEPSSSAAAGGRAPLRFRAPEGRAPVAQTFAAVTSSVPIWGQDAKAEDDEMVLLERWRRGTYGPAFAFAAGSNDALPPPQHGAPERTLLSLFLVSHGYLQRVPLSRLREYEASLFAALSSMPAPVKKGSEEEEAKTMIAEGSAFSELGKKQLKEASGAQSSEDDEATTPAPAFGSAAVDPALRGFRGGQAPRNLLEAALSEPLVLSEKELEQFNGAFLVPLTDEQKEKEKKRIAKGGKGTPIEPKRISDLSLLSMREGSVRADIATMLREATVRLAAAAAKGLSVRTDGGKDILAAVARGTAEEEEQRRTEQQAREEEEKTRRSKSVTGGFLSWLLAKPVVPPLPPTGKSEKKKAEGRLDVYGTMAAPPPGAPVIGTTPANAAAGAGAGATKKKEDEGEADPLAPVRGHIRLEAGVAFDLLPPVWKAMHVAVAEHTRRFCGEIPLPSDE